MTPEQIKKYNENQKNRKDMYCQRCNIVYKKILYTKCCVCGKTLLPVSNNMPKCPTCQSPNIERISTTKKAIYGVTFGLFSKTATSQFECKNCGYKW